MKILESQTQRRMRIFDPRVSIHATSEGLMVSQPTSIHGMSCVLLAEDGKVESAHMPILSRVGLIN